jgi:hypothetical protein
MTLRSLIIAALLATAPLAAQPATSRAVEMEPWDATRWTRVLAESGGVTITEADLRAALFVFDLTTGKAATPGQRKAFEKELVAEFNADPMGTRSAYDQIHGLLATVSQAKDPGAVAALRYVLVCALHKGIADEPGSEKEPFNAAFLKAMPAVAISADGLETLTGPDVKAYVNLLEFQSWLEGGPKKLPGKIRTSLETQLAANFGAMAPEERQLVGSGTVLWGALQAALKAAKPEERKALEARAAEARKAAQAASNPVATATGDAAYYRMLSEMSARSHATTMNILGAIGDNGDYWEFREKHPWE